MKIWWGWSNVWKEGGRRFKLECRSNGAGRFLFCSVVTEEAKRFLLIFPKERGFQRGWSMLVKKLRVLGVLPLAEYRGVFSPAEARSILKEGTVRGSFVEVVRKEPGGVGEVVWLQLRESEVKSREEQLRRCLVG